MRRLGDGAAGFVHEGAGQKQQRARTANGALACHTLKTAAPRPDAVALGDRLQGHKTDVVPVPA